MCASCTPAPPAEAPAIRPRPRRRLRAGTHEDRRSARLMAGCGDHTAKVWFTSSEVLCGTCGHPLEEEHAAILRSRLQPSLRATIGRLNNLVADDWDDSEDGTIQMAKQLRETYPYLRLGSKDRRRSLFRIASLQHQMDALDMAGTMSHGQRMAEHRRLDDKITTEITYLLKAAI